ncbi:hypothetical protein [Flavonifractor phage Chenonceau]|nr:hypothetical protein [Flavonifractor phage Chenonceau]DAI49358.1 MAG TPA: hypothetical protein [Caudoviricetes sp.]DAL91115.1 MAG TPA: hypothetical protein [Caudoviricetes sp.]
MAKWCRERRQHLLTYLIYSQKSAWIPATMKRVWTTPAGKRRPLRIS